MASRYGDNNRRDRDYRGGQGYPEPARRPKKRGSAVGSFITTLLLVIAIGVFCYAAYMLYGYYRAYKAGTDEYSGLNNRYVTITDETSGGEEEAAQVLSSVPALENPDTVEEKVENAAKETATEDGQEKTLPMLINPIDFEELKAINEEIIGWIRIGALDLSYPVAQAEDNDYYLHRTFERVDNFAGCIFLNCDNTWYFTDQNTIIYGHNMKNGSMFGTLKKFQEQETYDKCPYFWIFTPEFIYQYRIFSCSTVSRSGDPYRTRFTTEEFQNFIDTSVANSYLQAAGVEVTADDRIVTLSTCTGDDATRLILQGKLEQIYLSAERSSGS